MFGAAEYPGQCNRHIIPRQLYWLESSIKLDEHFTRPNDEISRRYPALKLCSEGLALQVQVSCPAPLSVGASRELTLSGEADTRLLLGRSWNWRIGSTRSMTITCRNAEDARESSLL